MFIRLRGSCREQGTADHRNSGEELTQTLDFAAVVGNREQRITGTVEKN
ncbi:hypothetical protein BJP36_42690 [Moorena producens JHB]|uniref:Uncharacterized protein n=1 Tax=Moorena producens (strain JHB) TaxID=1454205 RepID=A0A9Q9SSY6_MOOP1|nr:hypothetical protein [Moorena producens]WAN69067.1 hypothetical protein BJP36_42690 [Moorena producens JHB]